MTKNKKIILIILTILLTLFTIRLFSGEDNWICQKGEWIQHGHPFSSAPTTICE